MMNRQIFTNGATGGFLLALVTAMLAVLGDTMEYQVAEITGLAVMLAGAFFIQWFSLRRAPATEQGDFPARLKTVISATLAMCLAYGGVLWLFYGVLAPDTLAGFHERYAEEIIAAASDAEDRAARIAFIEQNRDFMLDPFKQAMLMAGTLLGLGALTALLTAALQRPRRDT